MFSYVECKLPASILVELVATVRYAWSPRLTGRSGMWMLGAPRVSGRLARLQCQLEKLAAVILDFLVE